MSGIFARFRIGIAAAVLTLFAGVGAIHAAEQPSADQILNALKPKSPTRSLAGGAPPAQKTLSPEEQSFIDTVRRKRTRSLSVRERERVATIAKERPSIDLEINFEYNSANISPKAVAAVRELGKALSNPELKGGIFLVAGHTDASGGEEYNQGLSERRAETIKRYLIEHYDLKAENLVAVGYGKTQLKNASNPLADENRRVQVVNMETAKAARN
jgi:outer membrane protein OmpA-like peptidoglycan-associated protein